MGMRMEVIAASQDRARRLLASPEEVFTLLEDRSPAVRVLSLEKSWHGLHFTLTGSAWDGDPPLNLLLAGEPVGDVDVGYGPARLHRAAEVRAAAHALVTMTNDEFARRFNPAAMAAAEIYPSIWDEPMEELLQEYGGYFSDLRGLVVQAADDGMALVVVLT